MRQCGGAALREEDGLTDWGCGVALKELLVEVLWDVGDKSLLGGVGAECWTKWLQEEGRPVHLLRDCLKSNKLSAKLWRVSGD